jgi:hypothetical protein
VEAEAIAQDVLEIIAGKHVHHVAEVVDVDKHDIL